VPKIFHPRNYTLSVHSRAVNGGDVRRGTQGGRMVAVRRAPCSFELISRIISHLTVFFSHNKPANSTFSHNKPAKRTCWRSVEQAGAGPKVAGGRVERMRTAPLLRLSALIILYIHPLKGIFRPSHHKIYNFPHLSILCITLYPLWDPLVTLSKYIHVTSCFKIFIKTNLMVQSKFNCVFLV
jgi:hypothetical protein